MNVLKYFLDYKIQIQIGIFISVLCFFLPLTTTCEWVEGTDEEYKTIYEIGYSKFSYYLALFFLTFIVLSSYLGKGSMILCVIFSTIGGFLVLGINFLSTAGWGAACGHSPTIYLYLMYLGNVLIVNACFMRIRSIRKTEKKSNADVLDYFDE